MRPLTNSSGMINPFAVVKDWDPPRAVGWSSTVMLLSSSWSEEWIDCHMDVGCILVEDEDDLSLIHMGYGSVST